MPTTQPEGVDVSNHNGTIDWHTVANAGSQFAYVKATEGTTFNDRYYNANIQGAKNAGLMVGSYHYFRRGDPQGQARHFLARVSALSPGDLPPALDYEEAECILSEAHTWCDIIEQALGRQVLLYTYKYFWIHHELNTTDFSDH